MDDVLPVMTLTPGDAGLWSTLVIPAPSQAVSVREARALAMAAGALTGAPPLATVILGRKKYLNPDIVSQYEPLHPSILQTWLHSCSGHTRGDLRTEHTDIERFCLQSRIIIYIFRV